jgi:pimeloyl-ACP methyl ester carboxylesterase
MAIAAVAALLAAQAFAADIPIPTQAGWVEAKKTVKLVNGITMAYVEMGNTDGPYTLLLHGFGGTSRDWSLLAPYLKTRHLYAIDLRGHGGSDAPQCCYGYADLANDATLFLDAMGIGKADVIGHSLGSLAAQLLAAQHPGQVDHLVLISSTTAADAGPGSPIWNLVMNLKAPVDPDGDFMNAWYATPTPADQDFLAHARAETAAIKEQVWQGVAWGMALDDLASIAPLVKAPVLVLWGEKDTLFDLSHQEKLEKAYPDAEFEIFEKGGHNMFWEFPDKAARVINPFLDAPSDGEQ